jgi:uncharacterized repeat protein (TIGR01451 family)
MKTQTITSQLMRTLLLLLLFVSGFAYAQPPINIPLPYVVCDDNNDGIAVFELHTKDPEIITQLGTQITYHLTSIDAITGSNPITLNLYNNSNSPYNQTLYVRAIDPADPNNPATTTLSLIVNPKPNFGFINNQTICTGESTVISIVNMGQNSNYFYNWITPAGVPNPGNVTDFVTNVPGLYYVIVTEAMTNCSESFSTTLSVFPQSIPIFSIPNVINSGSTTSLPTTSNNGISGSWSPALAIGTSTYTFSPYGGQCAANYTTSITVIATPTANQAPNLMVADNPYDGFATFDLTSQNAIINNNSGIIFEYFQNITDAQNNTNQIPNPTTYTNSTNPQTIYVSIFDPTAPANNTITSFQLIVTDPNIVYIPDANFKSQLLYGNIAYGANSNSVTLDVNGDGEIQVTEALLAYRLDPVGSSILSLVGIRSFLNLRMLNFNGGNLNSLDLSGLLNLKDLSCENNQMSVLNISNCPALETIFCGSNSITTLDLSAKPVLRIAWCELNQITALNVTNSPLLNGLSCRNNPISVLDLTNNIALTDLNCGVNFITSLDVSHCVNLINFHCHSSPITSLDVSNCPNLCNFLCIYNNNLTQLNIKNGNNNCYTQFGIHDNPNLQFVCTDDNETNYFENYFTSLGANINVNSYCNFNSGGNHNTITGQIKLDANNNGCDASDLPQPFVKVNINDGTNSGATFTDVNGNYKFYTPAGSFTLTPEVEHPTWFSYSATTIPFANNNNNTTTQDFCITPNGNHQDIEIVIEPITPARPGFYAQYKIVFKNKGNSSISGSLNFNYNDALLDYVSATVAPNSQNVGVLNWNYANLLAFESRSFYVTLHVNSPTATPPVNIGTILNFSATINPIATDENQSDNQFSYNQTVIGSYDPNEITCIEGNNLPTSEIGKYLHYGITFENTGNYYAENVVVKDVIDTTKYDINSIQLLDTSNPVYTRITGNVVEFIFENINLAASSGNPPVGGHGDVLFKIKSLSSLVNGEFVTKSAKIYFDYNAPIETNEAQTTYQTLSNAVHQLDASVTVSPNPTNSIITISSKFDIKSIELYDVQGRILETSIENDSNAKLDISEKQNGIYFLKITTENGSKVEKIVKE